MPNKFIFFLLFIVVIAGGTLRLFKLTSLPPSLNWDEVSHAYTAFSLLKTGRDQWGASLPLLNFRAYGDYPAALDLYFTVPSIALFGPTDLAVRFPHALAGILVIVIGFMAAYRWTGNKYAALATAVFLSLDPWTLFPSRAVFQSNWVVLTLSLVLAYLPTQTIWANLFLGLSLLAYHNARIFVPLFTGVLAFTTPKQRLANLLLVCLSALIITLPSARARTTTVNLLDAGSIAQIESQRNASTLSPFLARLVYNRPVYLISKVASNYLGYFSPDFLFIHGGTQYQFSLPRFGVLSLIQLPLFYAGLILLLWRVKYRRLFFWLLLAPLPAAITRDQFAVIRATTMLPVVQLVSGLAIAWLFTTFQKPSKPIFLIALIVLSCFFQLNYVSSYFSDYGNLYSQSWQYGHSQLVAYLKNHYADYDQIIITKKYGEPHEFLLWNWPWPPQDFQTDQSLVWDYHANWYWVNHFAKFTFVNDWELPQTSLTLPPRTLVVSSPDNPPLLGGKVSTINFLDGTPAFIFSQI